MIFKDKKQPLTGDKEKNDRDFIDSASINEAFSLLSAGFLNYSFPNKKLYVSPSLKDLFDIHLPDKDITVEILINQVHPDDKAFLSDLFNNSKSTKKKVTGQLRVSPKAKENKEMRYLMLNATFIRDNDDHDTLTCAIRDISKESKTLRDLQRNKEKAEEADNIKTIFLYNISHNIRTPMNSILGFAELLSMSDPGSKKRKEFISVIKKQSKNLLRLIDDVAEIAKYESGSLTITKSRCNLNLLLGEIKKDMESLRTASRKKQVDFKILFPSAEEVEIYADAGRIHQIFQNIIGYLFKHSVQGSIEFGCLLPNDGKIDFFVKDSILELAKDEQKSLFDRYSQFDVNAFNRYNDETGLRLIIAKGIVKLLGGRIWIESETGGGTTFNFSLPFEEVPTLVSDSVEDEYSVSGQYKWGDRVILIVEDEEVNGLFLEAVFQETHAQTLYAKNGKQAVELCKSINKIDLILMDIRMPVMNGIKATQEIRKFNKNVPIIAQTALALQEDIHNCLQAGCNDTITKPIDVEELINLTNKYFSH